VRSFIGGRVYVHEGKPTTRAPPNPDLRLVDGPAGGSRTVA
jgi:hypothetical protein